MSIGEQIKKLRKQNNLTQSDLSELLGMKRQNIGNMEKSLITPTANTIIQLTEIFDVSADYILETKYKGN